MVESDCLIVMPCLLTMCDIEQSVNLQASHIQHYPETVAEWDALTVNTRSCITVTKVVSVWSHVYPRLYTHSDMRFMAWP